MTKSKTSKPIVVTSGYFDPLHVGHIECFEESKKIADKMQGELIVIVNNDKQAALKKGKAFMPEQERLKIVQSLKMVDRAILSIDEDKSVCKTLELLRPQVFTKGGDRMLSNIPEAEICKRLGIKVIDNLGKKIQSSSELIKNADNIKNGK